MSLEMVPASSPCSYTTFAYLEVGSELHQVMYLLIEETKSLISAYLTQQSHEKVCIVHLFIRVCRYATIKCSTIRRSLRPLCRRIVWTITHQRHNIQCCDFIFERPLRVFWVKIPPFGLLVSDCPIVVPGNIHSFHLLPATRVKSL